MPATIACDRLESLPGWEIISEGLADAAAARVTAASCAIWIAQPRLARAGLIPAAWQSRRIENPEHTLYALLCREGGNAYGRYNSLLRRLVRFEHALDRIVKAA